MPELIHDRGARRFRLPLEDGSEAYLEYTERQPGTLDLAHTIVPSPFRGHGIGSDLVERVLRYARDEGHEVVPSCPFVAAFIRKHPEYEALVAGEGEDVEER